MGHTPITKLFVVCVEFIFHCILVFLFTAPGNPTWSGIPVEASF